jgi:16S rRNA processing protein RimM
MEHVPTDLVAVGRILGAWGIRGGVKVRPYAADGDALIKVGQWWIERAGRWESQDVLSAKLHGDTVTAELMGCAVRETALQLKGLEVWIARSRFPPLADDEYYWVDLIGLDVVNRDGAALGVVRGMMDNPAHAILEVRQPRSGEVVPGLEETVLIPFVERYIKAVERDRGRIVVDWDTQAGD